MREPGVEGSPQRTDFRVEALCVAVEGVLKAIAPSLVAGAAAGVGVWAAVHPQYLEYFRTNKIPSEVRQAAVAYPVVGAGLGVLLVWALALRRRAIGGGGLAAAWTVEEQRLRPIHWLLLSGPLLAFWAAPSVEVNKPGLLLTVIAGVGASVGYFVANSRWPSLGSWTQSKAGLRAANGASWCLVAAAATVYSVYLSLASIAIHRRLGSHLDLAVYENVVWQTANGNFLGCSICKGGTHASSHFDPILAALAPIYRLFPSTSTLLVAQSIWLSLGAFPLFALARSVLRSSLCGALLSLCYLLSPALHGANLFGFHSLVLCAPLVLSALYFLQRDRRLGYWISLALLLLVREDMALVACSVALYAYSCKRRKLALATVALSGAYLLAVKTWGMVDSGLIMQETAKTESFAHYFRQMIPYQAEGAKGLLVTLVTNPVRLLVVLFRPDKLSFFALLLGPVLLLPLLGGRRLWACCWGGIFIGLASRKPVFSPHFQYSLLILPGLMAALPFGIARVARSRVGRRIGERAAVRAAVGACLVASLLASAKFGLLAPNEALRGGWARPVWSFEQAGYSKYRDIVEMAEMVPRSASLAATRGLIPYVAGRLLVGLELDQADYVMIDKNNFDNDSRRVWRRAKQISKFQDVVERRGIVLKKRQGSRAPRAGRSPNEP